MRLRYRHRYSCDTAFQSTHPCGVRRSRTHRTIRPFSFNPRTRVGCDVGNVVMVRGAWFQSTHPCGVRRGHPCDCCYHDWFQSTHPCGVRRVNLLLVTMLFTFQSTHPCGVRRTHWSNGLVTTKCFNPRTRVGCDKTFEVQAIHQRVSIHAPVWGATFLQREQLVFSKVSIHAPVWGAT